MGTKLGKIFGGPLTKAGLTSPTGTTYFDSPQAATEAASKQLPSAESILGTADVLHPENNVPALPKVVQPTFAEAQDDSRALTSKGAALSMLLAGAEGAGAGAAVASEGSPRTGYPSPLVGLAAGFKVPFEDQERRLRIKGARLRQQREQAEIDALPSQLQQEHDLRQSEIDRNRALADRKSIFQVQGGGLYQREDDGSLKELRPSKIDPSESDKISQRQQMVESGVLSFDTPRQKQAFINGEKYSPLDDPDSAAFKERARIAGERNATSRANAATRKGLTIKGKAKDSFAQFGGRSF